MKDHADQNVKIILVGNKSDLIEERAISTDEAQSFASGKQIAFMETSAYKSINVEKAFMTLIDGSFMVFYLKKYIKIEWKQLRITKKASFRTI